MKRWSVNGWWRSMHCWNYLKLVNFWPCWICRLYNELQIRGVLKVSQAQHHWIWLTQNFLITEAVCTFVDRTGTAVTLKIFLKCDPLLLPRRGATMASDTSCPAVYHLLFHFWPLGIKMRLFRFRNVRHLIWKVHSCSSAVTSNLDTFILVVFQPLDQSRGAQQRFIYLQVQSWTHNFRAKLPLNIGMKKHSWALDSSSCWQGNLWTEFLSHTNCSHSHLLT